MYYKQIPNSSILEDQRLNFRLPDFTRIIWASGDTRKYWPDRIRKAGNDWQEIEKLTFQEGLRDSILISCKKDQLYSLKEWANKVNGSVVVLSPTNLSNSYSSYGNRGEGNGFRVAVTREHLVGDWYDAWNGGIDNVKIGELLGYPKCCQNFFEKYWVEEEWRDLTYPAYMNTPDENWEPDEDISMDEMFGELNKEHFGSAQGPIESNILGRWLGIRWVSHMPCSFDCEHSVEIGKNNRELAKKFGYSESVDIIDEVLSWPFRWSALHGILEIKTPVCKVSAGTEATSQELVIEREGKQPEKAASGLGFPFENKMPRSYTEGKRFEDSLDAVYETDLWEDNGFTSKDAMRKSHEPIIDIIDGEYESIIDLGCGNGVLLEQLRMKTNAQLISGVEINSNVVERGKERFPNIRFFDSDIFEFEFDKEYELSIFMPGRLTEIPPDIRDKFLIRLLNNSKFFVFYIYGDWVEKYGTVHELVKSHIGEDKLILLDEANEDTVSIAKYQII